MATKRAPDSQYRPLGLNLHELVLGRHQMVSVPLDAAEQANPTLHGAALQTTDPPMPEVQ